MLHNTAGILGMAKRQGERHSAASQFYITLNPLEYMNGKNVAFGRVISGTDPVTQPTKRQSSHLQTDAQPAVHLPPAR
jgi:cyclophilin family peptidyl-prolyl cis-trans isomerase